MREVALLTVLCFGCATARPPSGAPLAAVGSPPARVGLAEPELELWMEGTRRPDPEESARTVEDAREALARALEDRGLDGVGAPDALLAIRARAVARTGERRTAQVVSGVAIVAAVVAVIALVILGREHGRSHRSSALPASRAGGSFPAPARGWRARPVPASPAPFFWGWSVGVHVVVPVGPSPAPGPPGPPPGPAPEPEPDALLDPRGWFDGDEVELVAELADPETGEVRWRSAVRAGADPRDPRAMRTLVDRALEGLPGAKIR